MWGVAELLGIEKKQNDGRTTRHIDRQGESKMKVNRKEFLVLLTEAQIGLSKKEVLEQSNCFVFTEGKLVTFNDEIYSASESGMDFDAIVIADDLMKILGKMPDEEVDINLKGDEMIVTGKKRSAGITCAAELHLPFEAVPVPGKWGRLKPEFHGFAKQAARTCGSDETQYKSTCIHVTPEHVESCDNHRLFRAEGETGFKEPILIPASSFSALNGLTLKWVSVGEGWVHFTTSTKQVISLRCSHEKYHDGLESLLSINGEEISLPKNLAEMIERAEVMNKSGYDSRISIVIGGGKLKLMSRKDGGWFKEEKKVSFKGDDISFQVHPQFMAEVLERSHKVTVGQNKLKIESDGVQFVCALDMPEDNKDEIPF